MFVAGFIGSPPINFIDGRIKQLNGLAFINEDLGLNFEIPEEVIKGLSDHVNRDVVMGIRPEDLTASPGTNKKHHSFSVSVNAIEQMGNEMLVYAPLGMQQLIARLLPDAKIKSGDNIDLYFDTSRMQFFDKQTEKVIR